MDNIYDMFPDLLKFKDKEKTRFIILLFLDYDCLVKFSNYSLEDDYSSANCIFICYRKSGKIFKFIRSI